MAKKSFKENAQQSLGGLNAIIRNTTQTGLEKPEGPELREGAAEEKPVKKERPQQTRSRSKPRPEARPASEAGCKEGETRKTFIIQKDLAEQMLDIAYWEPGKLKDHVNAALAAYAKKHWTKKRPKGA
ncbi:MAG: hypothetical protein D6722_01250 [Bacteroidetes bacterium]|nr:MAG: hypothetical protein D6722_01250 [Bacteroidota bacterium]